MRRRHAGRGRQDQGAYAGFHKRSDTFLVYQCPTAGIDTDAILEDGGKEVSQIQAALDDTAGMICLSHPDTSILPANTKRKGDLNESIIYTGAW